ncbi:MAG: hypothetical protein LBH63_00355, partial [Clostridiales Family XIII bacterium]|nr:hypothetical protein [Clostridiales Family XIII bacterium]
VRELSADERMRAYAEAREKARRDEVASLAYAKTEGIEIGKAEGKTEGIEIGEKRGERRGIEQTMKAAHALREGKSIEEASRISGLDIETVRALANG